MSLSNIFIIGAHRSGTTSLYRHMGEHPDIQTGLKKEYHYFTRGIYSGEYPFDLATYLSNFRKTDKTLLEASPSYLYGGKELARLLKKEFPNSKILLILRQPTDRFFSFARHYNSRIPKSTRVVLSSFIALSKAQYATGKLLDTPENRGLREGVYANSLADWLEVFGVDLKIIFFKEFKDNTRGILDDCYDFLGFKEREIRQKEIAVHNNSRDQISFGFHKLAMKVNQAGETFFNRNSRIKKSIKKLYGFINEKPFEEEISDQLIKEVDAFYEPHNARLKELLEKNNLPTPEWVH